MESQFQSSNQNYRSDQENLQESQGQNYNQNGSQHKIYTPIQRIDAHQYEKKIQELLEKIDILESRGKLANEQKFKVVSKLKDLEDENDMLKDQVTRQNENHKQKDYEREKYEKTIEELKTANKAGNEKVKTKFEGGSKEIEDKEKDGDKVTNQGKAKEETIKYYTVNNEITQRYSNNYKDDLEQQKLINKKQVDKITELEKQIDSLYINKQSEGTLLLEIDHLKDDNIRLLQMLKSTEEFKDFAYGSETVPGGIRFIKNPTQKKTMEYNPSVTATSFNKTGGKKVNVISKSDAAILDSQNWVPSDAYSLAMQFKNKYNLDLSETLINDLLSSLNRIWKEREQKQITGIKSKYQSEIQGLRRKGAMSSGYDEFTASKKISRGKKELKQTRDDLRDNIVLSNKGKTSPCGIDLVDNALKVANSFNNTKKCLENEINNLKKQGLEKNETYSGDHTTYNKGCFWMAGRSCEEVEILEKNVKELFEEYEERVKNSNLITGQNEGLDFNLRIINNSVKWFFNSLKEMISDIKGKLTQWKFDTQKNLDVLKFNTNASRK